MKNLIEAVGDLEEEKLLNIVKEQLDAGTDPTQVLDWLRQGMDIVGARFANNEYFLVELILSAELFKKAMTYVEPKLLEKRKGSAIGKIVIGTVKGDVHDVGKNLVIAFLKSNGFEVHDLGEDVHSEKFIEKLNETGARILALSGLITVAHDSMKTTIEALRTAGIRNDVKVMIGGGNTNQETVDYTGADAFGKDATSAVAVAKQFIGELAQ